MKIFPIGIGTVIGIIAGFVLGGLLWILSAGMDAAMDILPDNGETVFFFIGFAACVALGLIYDVTDGLTTLQVKK